MFSCFVNYSTLTTDQRIQATLMQNLFENVHSVREEEATWSGRLPCAFFRFTTGRIPEDAKGATVADGIRMFWMLSSENRSQNTIFPLQ